MNDSKPASTIEEFEEEMVTVLTSRDGVDRYAMERMPGTHLACKFRCRGIRNRLFMPWFQ